MAKKAKQMTRLETLRHLCHSLEGVAIECKTETARQENRIIALRAEISATAVDLSVDDNSDPITAASLDAMLDKHKDDIRWYARNGRLTFHINAAGSWSLSFDSMYGGTVGSYRKLKNMAEIRVLIALLGVRTFAEMRASATEEL